MSHSTANSIPPTCQAPFADIRAPLFRPPKDACDAHCHVFGPAAKFPFAPNRKYTPPDAGKERLAQLHKLLGIERAVLVQASCHGTDNSAMLDAIASSRGRWKGVCIADDGFTNAQFVKLDAGGVRGVRFNFVAHLGGAPNLDGMRRVIRRVQPLGWHLVVHVNAEDLVTYERFFAEFDLPIVVDHMGRIPAAGGLEQEGFRLLLRFMRRENWWVKICGAERVSTSGPPFHDAVPFAQALLDAAPDRTLWGTDFPHPNVAVMPNDGELVDLIPLFARDAALQRKVLVENPARLYGWDVKIDSTIEIDRGLESK